MPFVGSVRHVDGLDNVYRSALPTSVSMLV